MPSTVVTVTPAPPTNPWLVTVNDPPFVVVMAVAAGPTEKLLPMKVMPTEVLVCKLPSKVPVPAPADWRMELAVMA